VDFVQDVWASFFANPPQRGTFVNPEHLVAFLAKIASNKVVDATRQRLQTEVHNVNRELSLNHPKQRWFEPPAVNQPTPSEVFTGRELWERLLRDQPLVYQRVLILRRDGKDLDEIATEMGIHSRTVRRILDKLRETMDKLQPRLPT
jgi:RNA polymerase sigma-70 factor (ECF subfamily)